MIHRALVLALVCVSFGALSFGCAASKFGRDTGIVDVQEFEVDGIKVLLRQSKEAPVVSAILYVRGGIGVLPADKPLTLESFALDVNSASGTPSTPKAVYRQRMLRMGSGIGGQDSRDYSLMIMRSTREHFDETWKFFAEKITTPTFDAVEHANLQKNVALNLQSITASPSGYSRYVTDSIFFAGHPYGRKVTQQDVQMTTIPAMREHLRSIFVKSRLVLSVVGNVSREELTAKMRAGGLTSLPVGNFEQPRLPYPARADSAGIFFVKQPRKLPTNYVVGYFAIPQQGDSMYYPYMRLRNFLSGNIFNSIRVEHNLAYAPSLEEAEWSVPVGIITFETAEVDKAIQLVYEDIDFFQQYLLKPEIISGNVDILSTSIFMDQETTQAQAEALGKAYVMTGDWRNAFISPEKLSAVSNVELNKAALYYLRNINWVVLGDSTKITKVR